MGGEAAKSGGLETAVAIIKSADGIGSDDASTSAQAALSIPPDPRGPFNRPMGLWVHGPLVPMGS